MSLLVNTSAEPITKRQQLVDYFAAGEKPKEQWRIGCEHENFPYRLSTLQPVGYSEMGGLRDLLIAMEDYGWKPVLDNDNVIGLTRGHAAISLEPGGQVELSGSPLPNLHEVAAEIETYLSEACSIADKMDIGFLGMGFHPTAAPENFEWVPKSRYKIMREYMPKRGALGHDMMLRTCSTQVNLDYASEHDMRQKFRVAMALQPIATALFASSPFVEGKLSGFNSARMRVWQDTDNDRCGTLPFVFADDFGYARYVDYALGVPMYFIYRDGQYIDCSGQSFAGFMAGKLPALPGVYPTLGDWANHLTTIFSNVRLKTYLEMRGADVGTTEMILALPSFWTGILYDKTSLDAAWEIAKEWTTEDHLYLTAEVPVRGLQTMLRGRTVLEIAHEVLGIARRGLQRRSIRLHGGADEARYLDILFNLTESRQNRADEMTMRHNHYEGFEMRDIFASSRLCPSPNSDVVV